MALQKKYIIAFGMIVVLICLYHYQFLSEWKNSDQVSSKVKHKLPAQHENFNRWKQSLANRTYRNPSILILDSNSKPRSKADKKVHGLPYHIDIHAGNSSVNSSHVNRTCFYFENGNIYKPVPWDKDLLRERHCSRRLPDAIIFGTRQCGSSKLDFYLRTHPDIAFTESEEMHFFGSPKERKGIDWYRNQMMVSKANQTTMEKTPKYLVRPTIPKKLLEILGVRTKLLLVIREPVERALYDFLQLQEIWYDKGTELMDRWAYFNGTIDDYYFLLNTTFEMTVLKPSGEIRNENALVYLGCYSFFIRRWLEYFPVSQIHVVNLADLEAEPVTVLKKVEKFLRIGRYFSKDNIYFNSDKQLHCLASPFNHCADETQGRVLPKVRDDVLQRLHKFYKPFNDELCEMLPQTCSFNWV